MKRIATGTAALLFAACATTTAPALDRSAPIEVNEYYGSTFLYAQHGNIVEVEQILEGLAQEEATAPHASRVKDKIIAPAILAPVSLVAIGAGVGLLAAPNPKSGERIHVAVPVSLIAGGAAAGVATYFLSRGVVGALQDAVDAHNARFQPTAGAEAMDGARPFVAVMPDGRGGATAAVGVAGEF